MEISLPIYFRLQAHNYQINYSYSDRGFEVAIKIYK